MKIRETLTFIIIKIIRYILEKLSTPNVTKYVVLDMAKWYAMDPGTVDIIKDIKTQDEFAIMHLDDLEHIVNIASMQINVIKKN